MHMSPSLQFQVFPTSGVPIYRQIMDQVKHHAASGRPRNGEFLPSVRESAAALEINPMTVSKAYSLLEREGVIELVRGQGMRLKAPAPDGKLSARREAILPLLKQVVATAYQLKLSSKEIMEILKPLLEDIENE
jgi:GntR family transcriptional regulator